MVSRVRAFLFAVAALGLLSACASGAQPEAMIANTTAAEAPANPKLLGAMSVGTVSGGSETNPMWASQVDNASFATALTESLRLKGYLAASPSAARYRVDAQLLNLVQPFIGFTFTVTSSVEYGVQGPSERRSLPITAEGSASFSDEAVGVKRLQIANERSIQANIRAFLVELSRY